jgi:hypothetical protein
VFSLVSRRALRRLTLFLVPVAFVTLAACDDDDHHHPAATEQPISLEFEHVAANDSALVYGKTYRNAAGQPYVIDSLKYYVSNVKLTRADGSIWTAPVAYYLIRATSAPADNQTIDVPAVPLGTYKSITFSVGIDSVANHTGDQPGVLSPRYSMLWNWNTGYRFLLLEGAYKPVGDTVRALEYHLGGDANFRTMTVTLPLPTATPATVTSNIAPEVHLAVKVNELFGGPNQMDFSDPDQRSVMMMPAQVARAAANVAEMFEVEHVHNDPHDH